MHAIEQAARTINGERVETFSRDVSVGGALLRVDVRRGDFHLSLTDGGGLELACCGDAALDALVVALSFATEALDDQRLGACR